MQEHPGVVGYPACLGDLMGSCGLIFLFLGFGIVFGPTWVLGNWF